MKLFILDENNKPVEVGTREEWFQWFENHSPTGLLKDENNASGTHRVLTYFAGIQRDDEGPGLFESMEIINFKIGRILYAHTIEEAMANHNELMKDMK